MPKSPLHTWGRAFTLIELVVVIVILGIAAAAIVPRFLAGSSRAAEVSATALRDVISSVATRSALTGQRVAVACDGARKNVVALTWRSGGRADDWASRPDWVVDSLTLPAALDAVRLTSVRVNGIDQDASRWRVEFDPGVRRPAVSIVVSQSDGPKSWRIDLPAGALHAELGPTDRPESAVTIIDLDSAGRSEGAW